MVLSLHRHQPGDFKFGTFLDQEHAISSCHIFLNFCPQQTSPKWYSIGGHLTGSLKSSGKAVANTPALYRPYIQFIDNTTKIGRLHFKSHYHDMTKWVTFMILFFKELRIRQLRLTCQKIYRQCLDFLGIGAGDFFVPYFKFYSNKYQK